jgi:hypothetical protein
MAAKVTTKKPAKSMSKASQKPEKTSASDTAEASTKATARPKTLAPKTRQLEPGQYRSFRLGKKSDKTKVVPDRPKLTAAPKLFYRACALLVRHWKVFAGVLVIYLLLHIILVGGIANLSRITTTKQALNASGVGSLASGFSLFGLLLTNSAGQSGAGSVYQVILVLVLSLALIWTCRQLFADKKVRIRDAFYQGMYPLVPFVLVLVVIALELLPLLVAAFLYKNIIIAQLAATPLEQALTAVIIFLLAVFSFYMLCSTLFALYVATLPDMTPMKAMRSARELVRYRRFTVLRKLAFLPFALLILAAAIMVPLALYVTPAAPYIFFVLSAVGIAILHSYMYSLYRELIL